MSVVRLPSGILAQFATNVELIDNASSLSGTFTASAYRHTLDKEPDSAMDGKYFVSAERILARDARWGTGENFITSLVTVQTSYFRGGGDAGEGDRQSVMRNAADDCQIIGDVCENPANYNPSVTGIREVRCLGSVKVHDLKHAEVWETTFEVHHRSDLATSPVISLEQCVIPVANRAALGAVSVSDYTNGKQALVADIGNGQPAMYVLMNNIGTSEGKLRIAAYGDTARQWVAGDGTFLPVQYTTEEIDFTTLASGVVLVPAFSEAGWLYLNRGTTNRTIITEYVGTLNGNNPQGSIGNNASHNNFVSAGANLVAAPLTTAAADGVPFTTSSVFYGGNTKMTDLQTAVTVTMSQAATGATLTLKGRIMCNGLLAASETFA